MSFQVIACNGYCGHNIEYVMRLADFMRTHIPEETDPHLFGLVDAIKVGTTYSPYSLGERH